MKLPTLEKFLESSDRNAWVTHEGFSELYVRRTQRKGFVTIDLANFSALEPGKGAFTALVKHLRKRYPGLAIYVESVLNARFDAKLVRMGFECTLDGIEPGHGRCFFLSPTAEPTYERREEDGAVRQAVQATSKDQL